MRFSLFVRQDKDKPIWLFLDLISSQYRHHHHSCKIHSRLLVVFPDVIKGMKSSLFTTTNTKVQLGITQTFCCISYLAAGCLRGSKLFWHASHFYCWNFLVTKKKIDRIVVEKLPKNVPPLHTSISVMNFLPRKFKHKSV